MLNRYTTGPFHTYRNLSRSDKNYSTMSHSFWQALFFIFFIICPLRFPNSFGPLYQAKKIPCPDRGKGLVFHIILHNRSFAFPE